MAKIVGFEYLKYQKEFLENAGAIDYTNFLNEIHFHESYTSNIQRIIKCLFCNTTSFNSIMLCSFMHEVENADVKNEVKEMINEIDISKNNKVKSINSSVYENKYYSNDFEYIQISFPPQVLAFFKSLLENPNMMTKVDVIAILGIIRDTKISLKLNEYIDRWIDVSNVKTEEELIKLLNNKNEYYQSLFKKYVQ
ncbi:TPA: hypothetical protein OZI11_002473 [Staphylococcus aureus]|nr:hypothetical protein [Staphylococcus aureus]